MPTGTGNKCDSCILCDDPPAGNCPADVLGELRSKREAALTYAALGFAVLPIRPDKTPYTTHGVKDATANEDQIHAWWTRWPGANVGLATGSGIVAVDIDPAKGGGESYIALERELGPFPATWTARTGGGGRHYLYKVPPGVIIPNRVGLRPGVDIRGDGGYIVVAPSDHASGGLYEWEIIPAETIADCPADLLIALKPRVATAIRGRHQRGERFNTDAEETQEHNTLLCFPSAVEGVSIATCQQINALFDGEAGTKPGFRHGAMLRLAPRLNCLPEARRKPAEFFKPWLFPWWEFGRDGACIEAEWNEAFADFQRAWNGLGHDSRTKPEIAFAAAVSTPPPVAAGPFRDKAMRTLVALCYAMQAVCADGDGKWFLSCRSAAVLLGVPHKHANKCLQKLCFAGVIERVEVPGAKPRNHSMTPLLRT